MVNSMYCLNYSYHFDACHQLQNYEGKCANLHGHRWEVKIKMKKNILTNDMVVDFTVLKKIIDKFDHKFLNEIIDINPTAENLARLLHDEIVKETGIFPIVEIFESPNASITYEDTGL